MSGIQAYVLCEYEPQEAGERRVRLLFVPKEDDDVGVFVADAWDGEGWTESTPDEFDRVVFGCLYEFWQMVVKYKMVD